MKVIFLGLVSLCTACLAHGGGEALYKQGAAIYKTDPVQALALFVQAAEVGSVPAMVGAGHCYEIGTGTEPNYVQAIEWYEKAVAHNSLKACEDLARIYASCDDPEFHNGEKAVKYASVIVRKKPRDAEALALLAAAYARNMEFDEAVRINAKAGKFATRNFMNELKERRAGYSRKIPYPSTSSEGWLKRSAAADSTWAMCQLGKRFSNKQSSGYDLETAIFWYTTATEKGYLKAYEEAGDAFLEMAEFSLAAEFYEKAVKAGLYEGMKYNQIPRRVYYREVIGADVEECLKRARASWSSGYTKRLNQNYDPGAEHGTSQKYYSNWSSGNPETAWFFFQLAALKGSSDAQKFLEHRKGSALCRIALHKLRRNEEEALELVQQAVCEELRYWVDFEVCAYLFARAGSFEQAVELQEEAIKRMELGSLRLGNPNLNKRILENASRRLEKYCDEQVDTKKDPLWFSFQW